VTRIPATSRIRFGGVRAARRLATVPAFTPADLGAALKWWMDPNFGIYSDAGTTPAVANDLVYRWVCRASGMIFDQPTSGSRPTLKAGANGKLYLDWAGSKTLICASHSLPTGNSARSFAIGIKGQGSGAQCPWSYGVAGNNQTYCLDAATGDMRVVGFNNDWASGLTLSAADWSVVDSTYDGTTLDLRKNGGTPATTTPSAFATSAGAAVLGAFITVGGAPFGGQWSHLTMTNTAVSAGDRASLKAFIEAEQPT